jgi:hypothetical protein
MTRGPKINYEMEQTILELYKSHFTTKEISNLLNVHYGTIAYRIQGFKIAKVNRYDRMLLISPYKIGLVNKEISRHAITE